MLQIAICDDEQFYREKIKYLLEEYLQAKGMLYTLHLFLSGEDFLEQCENNVRFDIVFLRSEERRVGKECL